MYRMPRPREPLSAIDDGVRGSSGVSEREEHLKGPKMGGLLVSEWRGSKISTKPVPMDVGPACCVSIRSLYL